MYALEVELLTALVERYGVSLCRAVQLVGVAWRASVPV
jgi:hypothetical protein